MTDKILVIGDAGGLGYKITEKIQSTFSEVC